MGTEINSSTVKRKLQETGVEFTVKKSRKVLQKMNEKNVTDIPRIKLYPETPSLYMVGVVMTHH